MTLPHCELNAVTGANGVHNLVRLSEPSSDVEGEDHALPLFEIALVLVRLDHVSSFIVNANHNIVWAGAKLVRDSFRQIKKQNA
jgi:hypothetical protein